MSRRLLAALLAATAGCSFDPAGVSGRDAAPVIVIDAGPMHHLAALPIGAGMGVMTSSPSGVACGAQCGADFPAGARVTMTAGAGVGSVFVGWGGACTGDQSCELALDQDLTVTGSFAPRVSHLWSREVGGAGDDQGSDVAIAPNGDVFVTGYTTGASNLGGGPTTAGPGGAGLDLFVSRWSAAGDELWTKRFGGLSNDAAVSLVTTLDGDVVVVGYFGGGPIDFGQGPVGGFGYYDACLLRLAGDDGHTVWTRVIGGGLNDLGLGIALAPNGDILATGYFTGGVFLGDAAPRGGFGAADVWLTRVRADDGTQIWSKVIGGAGDDLGRSIAATADGDVLIAGQFSASVDFGGGVTLTSAGNTDAYLARYSGDGATLRWARRFGSAADDIPLDLLAQGDEPVMAGIFDYTIDLGAGTKTSAGSYDAFIAAFAPDGTPRWSHTYGSAGSDNVHAIAVGPSGSTYAIGSFGAMIDFGGLAVSSSGANDVYVVQYSASGTPIWARSFGSPGVDDGIGLALDAAGLLTITGAAAGALDLGGGPLPYQGGTDEFLGHVVPGI